MTAGSRAIGGVGALAFWLVATAGWWALALWPLRAAPDWVARARAICFNTTASGLPDASGWLLLIGEPIGMLAALLVIWGRPVREGLGALAASLAGRALLAATLAGVLVGIGSVARLVSASAGAVVALPRSERPPDSYPRLDREAPPLGLVDQHGRRLDLAQVRGRPALVTFAFGSCESVCPLVVRQALEAQALQRARDADAAGGTRAPRVIVVTLDPWRDTPTRLAHIAHHWDLSEDAFVLSGDVDEVNAVLDAWNVARERDPRTGDVAHPPFAYVLDASGRIVYAAAADSATLVELLDRL